MPATSTRIARGTAEPSSSSSISGPITVTLPSSTSDGSFIRRSSNAGDRPPPNSTYISSLRIDLPSNAGEQPIGIGIAVTVTRMPRRSMPARTASFPSVAVQSPPSYAPVCRIGIPSMRSASTQATSSSERPGNAITIARARRSAAYASNRAASPGATPPNIIATRARMSAKWTPCDGVEPSGTSRYSSPTRTCASWSAGTTGPARKVSMYFSWSSRQSAAATSAWSGLPTIRQSPRIEPSTSEYPSFRISASGMKPVYGGPSGPDSAAR